VAEIANEDRHFDLWLIDVARGVASRLTTDPGDERDPVWSPDSREIVYSTDAGGDQDLLRKGLSGSEPAAPLRDGIGKTPGVREVAKAWYREGNTLLYLTIAAEHALWTVSLDGHEQPQPFFKGFAIDQPQVAPGGRFIAYISNDSGRFEVYLEPFQKRGARVRVSAGGGGQPRWRGDGKELFYLSLEGALMAVDVRDGAKGLEVGMPTTLVTPGALRAVVLGPDYSDYAVSSDGQRFLFKSATSRSEPSRIHVLLDWPALVP
jgi:Tol biopolymer transport system component